jgi:hypothetical protein
MIIRSNFVPTGANIQKQPFLIREFKYRGGAKIGSLLTHCAIPAPLLDVMAPYTPRASGFWADATMTSTYYSDEDEDLEQQDQLIGEDSDGRTPVCSGCYVLREFKSYGVLIAGQDH